MLFKKYSKQYIVFSFIMFSLAFADIKEESENTYKDRLNVGYGESVDLVALDYEYIQQTMPKYSFSNSDYSSNLIDVFSNQIFHNKGTASFGFNLLTKNNSASILVNGVKLKNYSDILSVDIFNVVPVFALKELEIFKGSNSAKYGSGASSGGVNFVFDNYRQYGKKINVNLFSDYMFNPSRATDNKKILGSFELYQYDGTKGFIMGFSHNNLNSYHGLFSSDLQDNDNQNLILNFYKKTNKGHKSRTLLYNQDKIAYDLNKLQHKRSSLNLFGDSEYNLSNNIRFLSKYYFDYADINYSSYKNDNILKIEENYRYFDAMLGNSILLVFPELVFSLSYEFGNIFVNNSLDSVKDMDFVYGNIALSTKFNLSKSLIMDFDYRADYVSNDISSNFALNENSLGINNLLYDIYSLGLTEKFTKNFKVFVRFGNDFKRPSVAQMFNPIIGNPELKSQLIHTYNLGGEYNFFGIRLNNTLSFQQNNNPIFLSTDGYIEGEALATYNNQFKIAYRYKNLVNIGFSNTMSKFSKGSQDYYNDIFKGENYISHFYVNNVFAYLKYRVFDIKLTYGFVSARDVVTIDDSIVHISKTQYADFITRYSLDKNNLNVYLKMVYNDGISLEYGVDKKLRELVVFVGIEKSFLP